MGKFKNLSGEVYGRLTVLPSHKRERGRTYWKCKCSCVHGHEVWVRADVLQDGASTSCGKCLHNTYDFHEDYVVGYTYNGEEVKQFLVDVEDYQYIKDDVWLTNSNGYIVSNAGDEFMHRVIMSHYHDVDNLEIDHINHTEGDNRKTNLRVCTSQQNSWNTRILGTIPFKGVVQDARNEHYIVTIKDGNRRTKASFHSLKHAIIFRVQQEHKIQGEYRYKEEDSKIEKYCEMSIDEILLFDVESYKQRLEKPVAQYDLDGNLIKQWDSTMQVARELGFNQQHVGACCRGVRKTHKGFKWAYLDNRVELS